jgi:hypothetical protein
MAIPRPFFMGPGEAPGFCHFCVQPNASAAGKGSLRVLVSIFQAGMVFQPEGHRIHPQFFGHDVHVDFLGDLTLGVSHAAHETPFGFIGVYIVSFHFKVGTPVYPLHRLHDSHSAGKVAIGAHIRNDFGLDSGQCPVFLGAVF